MAIYILLVRQVKAEIQVYLPKSNYEKTVRLGSIEIIKVDPHQTARAAIVEYCQKAIGVAIVLRNVIPIPTPSKHKLFTYHISEHEARQMPSKHWVKFTDALQGNYNKDIKLEAGLVRLIESLNKFFEQNS